jgi:hypothetical protein
MRIAHQVVKYDGPVQVYCSLFRNKQAIPK